MVKEEIVLKKQLGSLRKESHPDLDRGQHFPRVLRQENTYKNAMESLDNGKEHYYDTEPIPFTGIEDIDKILNMRQTKLGRSNQLVQMFGCRRCWMRGTSDCPFGVKDGDLRVHPNDPDKVIGYCDFALKSNLIKYKLMKTPKGLRHLRNINTTNMENMVNYYLGKLNDLRKSDRVTKNEMYLLKNLVKMQKELGERYDKSIQQDEGTSIKMETVLKVSDVNRMIRHAKSKEEIEVDAEVIPNEDKDEYGEL